MSKINRSIFVAISLTTVLIACFLLAPAAYTTLPGIVILALGGTTAILSWIDIFKISGELLGYKYPSFRAAAEDCSLLQPFFYSCLSRLTG